MRVFTRIIVTYVSIRTSDTSSMPHSTPLAGFTERSVNLPKHIYDTFAAAASVHGLARYIFRAGRLDQ